MYLHVQRIRDFFGNALYKFTFYLLTYLLALLAYFGSIFVIVVEFLHSEVNTKILCCVFSLLLAAIIAHAKDSLSVECAILIGKLVHWFLERCSLHVAIANSAST